MKEVKYVLDKPMEGEMQDDEYLKFYHVGNKITGFGICVDNNDVDILLIHVEEYLGLVAGCPIKHGDGKILEDYIPPNVDRTSKYLLVKDNYKELKTTVNAERFIKKRKTYEAVSRLVNLNCLTVAEKKSLEYIKTLRKEDKKAADEKLNSWKNSINKEDFGFVKTEISANAVDDDYVMMFCDSIISRVKKLEFYELLPDRYYVPGDAEKPIYPFLVDLISCIPKTIPATNLTSIIEYDPSMVSVAYERIRSVFDNPPRFYIKRHVISYLLSMAMLKIVDDEILLKKFALREAVNAENHIKENFNIEMINSSFGLSFEKHGSVIIPVEEYVRLSSQFNDYDWKLVNQKIKYGNVYVPVFKAARLLRSEMASKIISQYKSIPALPDVPALMESVASLRTLAESLKPAPITWGEYPPCIKHAIGELEKGENLSDAGRFMLGTYLISRGQDVDEIAQLFVTAPDYSEKITKYRLKHIKKSKYSVASCNKLSTQGLCFRNEDCGKITHPMQFGRSNYIERCGNDE